MAAADSPKQKTPERTKRLILEIELPLMFVDDIPGLIEEFGNPEGDRSEEILRDCGEISIGLLVVQVMGEKASEIVTVPALVRKASIEDEPPTPRKQWGQSIEALHEKADPDEENKLPNVFLGGRDA